MDWVGGGKNILRKTDRNEDRCAERNKELRYWCPGCTTMITGYRPFSDHKRDCAPFAEWVEMKLNLSPQNRALKVASDHPRTLPARTREGV